MSSYRVAPGSCLLIDTMTKATIEDLIFNTKPFHKTEVLWKEFLGEEFDKPPGQNWNPCRKKNNVQEIKSSWESRHLHTTAWSPYPKEYILTYSSAAIRLLLLRSLKHLIKALCIFLPSYLFHQHVKFTTNIPFSIFFNQSESLV